jgi:hypothetical protein
MKIWVVYSLIVTVLAVAAGSFALGVVISGGFDDSKVAPATEPPTERPQPEPTEYQPRLTATEAASKAKAYLLTPRSSPSADLARFFQGFSCETRDFNGNNLTWIVVCTRSNPDYDITYAVSDVTGNVGVSR